MDLIITKGAVGDLEPYFKMNNPLFYIGNYYSSFSLH